MTTQEFVKQEAEKAYQHGSYMKPAIDGFSYGLTKGLEIGLGFRKWRREYKLKYFAPNEEKLLSIYLTEINEKK